MRSELGTKPTMTDFVGAVKKISNSYVEKMRLISAGHKNAPKRGHKKVKHKKPHVAPIPEDFEAFAFQVSLSLSLSLSLSVLFFIFNYLFFSLLHTHTKISPIKVLLVKLAYNFMCTHEIIQYINSLIMFLHLLIILIYDIYLMIILIYDIYLMIILIQHINLLNTFYTGITRRIIPSLL